MWENVKHRQVNSGTLYIIYNHLFGSLKANFRPLHSQKLSLAYLMSIITWCWSIRALKASKWGLFLMSSPVRQQGFRLGSFGSGVEVLTHCADCNCGK